MLLVINTYYFIIDYTVSVLVFISTIFMRFFRVNFYRTLEAPFATCIIGAIKQAEVMVVIDMWEFQLWDKGTTARASSVTSGPAAPWLLKTNSFIVNFIIGDNVLGYWKRLATQFAFVFIPHCFDIISSAKQINLFCRGVTSIQNVYCFLRYFWRPFEAESCIHKV